MVDGVVVGRGGHLLAATEAGAESARKAGLTAETVDLSKSLFYTRTS